MFETFKTRNKAINSFIRNAEDDGDNEFNGPIFKDDKIIPFEKLKEESIRHALRITNGNIVEAARKLQLSQDSIRELMEKYNIKHRSGE